MQRKTAPLVAWAIKSHWILNWKSFELWIEKVLNSETFFSEQCQINSTILENKMMCAFQVTASYSCEGWKAR